jgi:hypothetical protein
LTAIVADRANLTVPIGLLPNREADRMGFAGWFNDLNKDFKDELRLLRQRPRDS